MARIVTLATRGSGRARTRWSRRVLAVARELILKPDYREVGAVLDAEHAASWLAELPALSQLQPVAVGILEHRHVAPRVLEHVSIELHAARFQHLERLPTILRLDCVRRRASALVRLAVPGSSWPENQQEVLTLETDSSRTAGHRSSGRRPASRSPARSCRSRAPCLDPSRTRLRTRAFPTSLFLLQFCFAP